MRNMYNRAKKQKKRIPHEPCLLYRARVKTLRSDSHGTQDVGSPTRSAGRGIKKNRSLYISPYLSDLLIPVPPWRRNLLDKKGVLTAQLGALPSGLGTEGQVSRVTKQSTDLSPPQVCAGGGAWELEGYISRASGSAMAFLEDLDGPDITGRVSRSSLGAVGAAPIVAFAGAEQGQICLSLAEECLPGPL